VGLNRNRALSKLEESQAEKIKTPTNIKILRNHNGCIQFAYTPITLINPSRGAMLKLIKKSNDYNGSVISINKLTRRKSQGYTRDKANVYHL
jgi:hypothetical protein